MTLTDLLNEMPYLHTGEMPRKILDGSISTSAIAREYTKVGTVHGVDVLIDGSRKSVIGVDASLTGKFTGRVSPVFRLVFKRQHELTFPNSYRNILQIDKVAIHEGIGNMGIMSTVYQLLVDSGFTLVSDNTQFEPAQAMWRKLASDPAYKVYIADVDHGIFKDGNGAVIVYTGKNIPDQDIWTSGSDMNGNYRVMILTK